MSVPDDKTLIDLQERLMHQERLLEALNEVVTSQQDTIDALRRDVTRLKQQLEAQAETPVDEPPPHY